MRRLVLLVLCLWGISSAIEVKDLNIAVIWNNETDSRLAPRGWKVGNDPTNSGLDTTIEACPAPEIGKAQMKMLLASFERSISFDSTLDTTSVPDVLTDDKGLPNGPHQGKLPKVRIYDKSSIPFTLDKIKQDFNDVKPDAIIYINAGAEWVKPGDDDGGLYKLLRDAADQDIGIMTIGDASLIDARNIDPSKKRFPVMGVQKTYRFKAYSSDATNDNDTIREFNFVSENDSLDGNGDVVWEIPDTVVLHSDYDATLGNHDKASYWIMLGKDTIYYKTAKNTPKINETILSDTDILHAYGEWSIKAKAVEVIDEDLYAPEMAAGVYPNHDLILTGDGWNGAVPKVSSKTWGEVLWVNGVIHAGLGTKLPDGELFGTGSGTKFTFDKDYVVSMQNIDDDTKVDNILVVKKGVTVETGDDKDLYADTYYAGGYKDLKIILSDDGNTANIFDDVFPTLKGDNIKELKFKPWTKGGRLKAAADIWAVNEKLNPKDFDDIDSNGFNPDAYYTAYLGDQVAGADGNPHFVKPPENDGPIGNGDFDKAAKEMRLDSLGYDQDGKLYHVISAIQSGHRRMVMLGFQPTYLADLEATLDLLEDATKWIAIDDYKLPTPQIIPIEDGVELVPADGQKIYTDHDSVKIVIDFTKKGIVLHETAFKLTYTIKYGAQTVTGAVDFEADDGSEHIEETMLDLSSLISIDPSVTADTQVEITVTAEPSVEKAPFDKSDDSTATLNIRKLTSRFENGGNNETVNYKGTYSEKIISEKTLLGDDVSDVKISFSKNGGTWQEEAATYSYDVSDPTLSIVATAKKDRFINSDTLYRSYKKEDLSIPEPVMDIKAGDVNGTGGYLFFKDTALFMGLTSYDVAGVPITDDDYDLKFVQSGANKTMPDTGRIELPLTYIDSLINEGHTKFVIEDAMAESQKSDTWKNSGMMEKQSYEFREVAVAISKTSGDDNATEIGIEIKATDPVTSDELATADIYYTLDGAAPDKNATGPVKSSDILTVPNGVTIKAIAYRSGYLNGSGEQSYSKSVYINADPASGTSFGESLDVELSSNHQPIFYKIDGGTTVKIDGTSGSLTLDDALGTLIRDNDTVVIEAWIEASANIPAVNETFTYYRRKLPAPKVDPPSGDYSGIIAVTASVDVDEKYDADIFYTTIETVTESDTKYTGTFNVTPDATLYFKAFAEDWLPSDSVEREYRRVVVSSSGDYFDADADGVIDSALVALDTVWDGLALPDTIRVEQPVTGEVHLLTDKSLFEFVGMNISIRFDDFSSVVTGFDAGAYITLYGNRYSKEPVTVGDKVAPVIQAARYNSGSYEGGSAERNADTLLVTFTEDIEEITSLDKKVLFNFVGATTTYTADVSLFQRISASEYMFTVDDLHGVTYPTRGDSIWINIGSDLPVITDLKGNEQLVETNRRVEMVVGKLDIQVIMNCYWIDRSTGGFDQIATADEMVTPVGGYTSFGIAKGALITIDPLIPYLESEVDAFDVKLKILDAVGNVVAEVDGIGSGEHIKALPAEMVVNKDGEKRIVIAVAWDGNNSLGRQVHRRTFKVEAITRWPNIEDEIKPKPALLPVMRDNDTD